MSSSPVNLKEVSGAKWQGSLHDISAILAQFDKAQEWADFATCLQRLAKVLQRQANEPHQPIPCITQIARALHKCLNPQLPSGIHSRTLKVYESILDRVGPTGIPVCLELLLPPVIDVYGYASSVNRMHICDIYQEFLIPCLDELKPLSLMIVTAVMLGTENEKSTEYASINKFLSVCEKAWGRAFAFTTLWQVVADHADSRSAALKLLGRRHEELGSAGLADSFARPDQVVQASHFCAFPSRTVVASERDRETFVKDARQFLDNTSAGLTYVDLNNLQILLGNLCPLLALDDVSINLRLCTLMNEFKLSFAQICSTIFKAAYDEVAVGSDSESRSRESLVARSLSTWGKNVLNASALSVAAKIYNVIVNICLNRPRPDFETLLTYNPWPLYLGLTHLTDRSEWETVNSVLPGLTESDDTHYITFEFAESERPEPTDISKLPRLPLGKSADPACPIKSSDFCNYDMVNSNWMKDSAECLTLFYQLFSRRKSIPLDVAVKLLVVESNDLSEEWLALYNFVKANKLTCAVAESLSELTLVVKETETSAHDEWPIINLDPDPMERRLKFIERLCSISGPDFVQKLLDLESQTAAWIAAVGYSCEGAVCASHAPVEADDQSSNNSNHASDVFQGRCVCFEDSIISLILKNWRCGRDLPPNNFVGARIEQIARASVLYSKNCADQITQDDYTLIHNTLWTHGLHSLERLIDEIVALNTEHLENSLTLLRTAKKPGTSPGSVASAKTTPLMIMKLSKKYISLANELCGFTVSLKTMPLVMSNTRALIHMIPKLASADHSTTRLPEIMLSMPEHTILALWASPPLSPHLTTNGTAWSCLHYAMNSLVNDLLPAALEAGDTTRIVLIIQALDRISLPVMSGELCSLYLDSLCKAALIAYNQNRFELMSLILNLILGLLSNTDFKEAPISLLSCRAVNAENSYAIRIADYTEDGALSTEAVTDSAITRIQNWLADNPALNGCEQSRLEELFRTMKPIFTALFQTLGSEESEVISNHSKQCSNTDNNPEAGEPTVTTPIMRGERVALIPAFKILSFLADRSSAVRLQFTRLIVRAFHKNTSPRVRKNVLVHLDVLVSSSAPITVDDMIDISLYADYPWLQTRLNTKHVLHDCSRHGGDMENLFLSCLNAQYFAETYDEKLRINRQQFLKRMLTWYEASTFMTLCTIWWTTSLTQQIDQIQFFETIQASGALPLERAWNLATQVLSESRACSVYGFLHFLTKKCSQNGGEATSPSALWKNLDIIASNTEANAYGAVSWICELVVILAQNFPVQSANVERMSKVIIEAVMSQKKPAQDLVPPFPPGCLEFEADSYMKLGIKVPTRYCDTAGRVPHIAVGELDTSDQLSPMLHAKLPRPFMSDQPTPAVTGGMIKPLSSEPDNSVSSIQCRWGDKIVCITKSMVINQLECSQQIMTNAFGSLVFKLTSLLNSAVSNAILAQFIISPGLANWLNQISLTNPNYSVRSYIATRSWLLLDLWSVDIACADKSIANLPRAKMLGKAQRPVGSRLRLQAENIMLIVCLQHISKAVNALGSMKGYKSVFICLDTPVAKTIYDEVDKARSLIQQTWANTAISVPECEPLQPSSIFSSRATDIKNKAEYLYRIGTVGLRLPAQVLIREASLWLNLITNEIQKTISDPKLDQAILFVLKVLVLKIGAWEQSSMPLWTLVNAKICDIWTPIIHPILIQGTSEPSIPVDEKTLVACLQLIEVAALHRPPLVAMYFAETGPLSLLTERFTLSNPNLANHPPGPNGHCGQVAVPFGTNNVGAACNRLFHKRLCCTDCAICHASLMRQLLQEGLRVFLISLEKK